MSVDKGGFWKKYPRKNKPVQCESPETPNKHHLKDFIIFYFLYNSTTSI